MKLETALNCIFCVGIGKVMTSTVRYTYQLSRILVYRLLLYENPCLDSFHDGFTPTGHVQFFIDILDMGTNSLIADKGFLANGFVIVPLDNHLQ